MIIGSISGRHENSRLPEYSAFFLESTKRIFYCNHLTKTISLLPPQNWWSTLSSQYKLPYGWEYAVDANNQSYYINHISKTTSYQSPINQNSNKSIINECRTVTLFREPEIGFGFVVGSEKPVIVRCVTKNGPSDGKLQAGDQILAVNGTNVQQSPREQVIGLIKSSQTSVDIRVKQPSFDQNGVMRSTPSSIDLNTLKPKQSRVRFAENVHVDEPALFPQSDFCDSIKPPVTISANILKVFLENGQTKSFKYDATTTVQNVIDSLASKLCLELTEYFSLLTEIICYRNDKRTKINLLSPNDYLIQVASRPGAHKLKCLFRIAYVPSSPSFLAQKDRHAFDYFYRQCCNDVLKEKFHPELDRDTTLHLAALQIYQQALSTVSNYSVTVKSIEKHDFFDLSHFVPQSLLDSVKRKEIVRILKHYLKMYISTSSTASLPKKSGKTLTVFQAKLLYLDIISQLPSYGAKCFNIISIPNSSNSYQTNTVLITSPKFGISQIFTELGLNSLPTKVANLDEIQGVRLESIVNNISDNDEIRCSFVHVALINDRFIDVLMEESDASELSLVLKGMCLVLYAKKINIISNIGKNQNEKQPVSYFETHFVRPEKWSYFQSANELEKILFTTIPDYQIFKASKSLLLDDLLNGREQRQLEAEAAQVIADSESYLKTSESIVNGLTKSTFPSQSSSNMCEDVIDLTDETNSTSDLLLSGEFSNMNLDEFLEKVIVPPPDSIQSSFENGNDNSLQLSFEDIKKFIIPPPPISSSSSDHSDDGSDDVDQSLNVKGKVKKFETGVACGSNCSKCCQKQNDSDDEFSKESKFCSTIDHLLKKTIFVLNDLLNDLNKLSDQCVIAQQHGGGRNLNETLFQISKNDLMNETLNLVTTSKTLIIAMSDMDSQSQQLAEHLATCLTIIRKMYNLSAQLVEYMSGPLQTRNLIARFTAVIEVFKHLLNLNEMDRSSQQAIEEFLAARAEELANTLANLLRSLRMFT